MKGLVLLAQSESLFDPASPGAGSIRNLSILVLAITGFIFILVEGILLYAVVRFRRSTTTVKSEIRNPKSETNPKSEIPMSQTAGDRCSDLASEAALQRGEGGREAEPPQVYGSKPIEIAWTAAPALIVFVLVLVTIRTLWEVAPTPPQPRPGDRALFVTVIGHQWWWEYRYDHYDGKALGFVTANELYIPVGADGEPRPVYLALKSADVCHSFGVPRLAGKTDLIPGRTNYMWFQTDKPDLYLGQCAEYCGTQHANMLIRVIAESPADFDRWLANQMKDQAPKDSDPEPVKKGRKALLEQSCVNCHRVAGTAAQGTYGPDLTHLMSRATLATGMVPNTAENLRQWIADPQKVKPGCLMPSFGLSAHDRGLIVDYMLTLH